MKVCVAGASGYAGQVLMRLLLDHPEVRSVLPVSSTAAGQTVDTRDTGLGAYLGEKLPAGRLFLSQMDAAAERPDALFSALPHGVSGDFCRPFGGHSVIFDLSADFRIRDAEIHAQTYGSEPPWPDQRGRAVYGLAEIYRDKIKTSDLIAVPGCYPTSVLLPLIPAARKNLIAGTVTVNSLSGISGAGRSAKEASLFVERAENMTAYNPGSKHRHHPEMLQELQAAGCDSPLLFTPHLVPLRRGMFSTISVLLNDSESAAAAVAALRECYADQPCVSLTESRIPATRDVVGSNRCDIGWHTEDMPDGSVTLQLYSVLDNLMKGAAGQAVQDFNIRFGFPQETGLPLRGEV